MRGGGRCKITPRVLWFGGNLVAGLGGRGEEDCNQGKGSKVTSVRRSSLPGDVEGNEVL